MPFPAGIIARAWNRQGGRCAYCGRVLTRANRDKGEYGAWHPHHRKPQVEGGTDVLRNCVILCVNPPNCHFSIGHGGVGWMHYEPLSDSELPYLYEGRREVRAQAKMQIPIMRTQPPKKVRRIKHRRRLPHPPQPSISTVRIK
jgi:hypothetical protein